MKIFKQIRYKNFVILVKIVSEIIKKILKRNNVNKFQRNKYKNGLFFLKQIKIVLFNKIIININKMIKI